MQADGFSKSKYHGLTTSCHSSSVFKGFIYCSKSTNLYGEIEVFSSRTQLLHSILSSVFFFLL